MTLIVANARQVAAGWVLVAYACLGVIAFVGWTRYWVGPVARQRAAVAVLVLLALYSGAQGIIVQQRKSEIRRVAERRFGARATTWAALTDIGQPFTWEAIYASADTVAGDDWALPRHLRAPAVVRALQTHDGRAMAQFARFLAAEVDTSSKTVYLRDARYARMGRDGWGVVPVRID